MLVLNRYPDESVIIDNKIEVAILNVRGDKVSLGIKAPKDVSVHRKEIQDAIDRENQHKEMLV